MLNNDYKEMLQILSGNDVPLISRHHLIKNKLATGQKKDELDANQLT